MDLYMELPEGFETKHGTQKDHILKLEANLYGQEQAGQVWNQYLVDKLASTSFKQSSVDKCVFYCKDVIFTANMNDGIF